MVEIKIEDIDPDKDYIKINEIRNLNRCFLHNPIYLSKESTLSFLKENKEWKSIKVNTNLVGYFRIKKVNNDIVYIGADISPEYQQQGIAQEAYRKMIQQLKQLGFKTLVLEVLSFNERAIYLYNKLGFTKTKEEDFSNSFIKNIKSITMEMNI